MLEYKAKKAWQIPAKIIIHNKKITWLHYYDHIDSCNFLIINQAYVVDLIVNFFIFLISVTTSKQLEILNSTTYVNFILCSAVTVKRARCACCGRRRTMKILDWIPMWQSKVNDLKLLNKTISLSLCHSSCLYNQTDDNLCQCRRIGT